MQNEVPELLKFNVPPELSFVFGSNLSGRHGAGAAKWARQYRGAIYGQGVGMQGNSYAIPTKDFFLKTLPLQQIQFYIFDWVHYAMLNPKKKWFVSRIGCGLAGYQNEQIAPLFVNSFKQLGVKPLELYCLFDPQWKEFGLPVLGAMNNDICRNRQPSNAQTNP